jgi:ATP-binding cassette subfamily F protein uup
VGQLSGGERNRVLLAKLLIQGGNVVILDEPTNDLDLATLRALEEALMAFEGTVIVVSHDRWFLDRVATEIVHLDGRGNWMRFGGSLSTLLERVSEDRRADERKAKEAAARLKPAPVKSSPKSPKAAPKVKRRTNWQEKELAALPAKLEAAEARLAELAARIEDPALYAGPAEERERVQQEHATLATEIEQLYARWEELDALRD